MYFYNVSTDDYFCYGDEGGDYVHFTRGATQQVVMHAEKYEEEMFFSHVKEAYKAAMRFAPDRLRKVANGEDLNVSFEKIIDSLCERFGYERIVLQVDQHLEKEAVYENEEYDEYGSPKEVIIANILKEKKKVEEKTMAHWDEEWEDFVNSLPSASPGVTTPVQTSTTSGSDSIAEEFDKFLQEITKDGTL